MTGEIRTAIKAVIMKRPHFFIDQPEIVSCFVTSVSMVVTPRSNLQDRQYENHQKHRDAFARGLPNYRRSFRVRLESGASHLPTLRCSSGCWRLDSHRQMIDQDL